MILGKNIIAVNQSKEMLELLFDLDYKIMEAEDCIEGIRSTIRYRPDLVVAEINSPNLNGLSMARILKTLLVSSPLILTASDEKFRKYATSFDNVYGFILNQNVRPKDSKDTFRSDFESIIFNLDNFQLTEPEFSYSFRQHEWANLIGKSNNKRLLIIEDDEDFRKAILKKIDFFNIFDLFSAKDGLEGVFKALLIEPDLILSDIKMPILDGMAMSQLFFILNKPFPIVFLSAVDDKEIRQKSQKANGVLGYMEKEMLRDKTIFVDQIESYLNKAATLRRTWKELYQQGATESLKKDNDEPDIL